MRDYPGDVEGLIVSHDGSVLSVTLDRPDRRNAITDEQVMALIDLVEVAGTDATVRVIALGGSGDHFCSGFDLAGRSADGDKARVGAMSRRLRWHVNRLVSSMLETQTPIVAAVKGWAVGLGLNLVLACDFAVVADDARFKAPFTESGFTPDSGSSWLLPRLVGVARAKEMLMLGRTVDGAGAAEWGMVHRSVPSAEVDPVAAALVAELAGAATVAVGMTKLLVQRAATAELERHLEDEALAIELSSRSDDFHEWQRARRDGRATDFEGR